MMFVIDEAPLPEDCPIGLRYDGQLLAVLVNRSLPFPLQVAFIRAVVGDFLSGCG